MEAAPVDKKKAAYAAKGKKAGGKKKGGKKTDPKVQSLSLSLHFS